MIKIKKYLERKVKQIRLSKAQVYKGVSIVMVIISIIFVGVANNNGLVFEKENIPVVTSVKFKNNYDLVEAEELQENKILNKPLVIANDGFIADEKNKKVLRLKVQKDLIKEYVVNLDLSSMELANNYLYDLSETTTVAEEESETTKVEILATTEILEETSGKKKEKSEKSTKKSTKKTAVEETKKSNKKTTTEKTKKSSKKTIAEETKKSSKKTTAEETKKSSKKTTTEETKKSNKKMTTEETKKSSKKTTTEETKKSSSNKTKNSSSKNKVKKSSNKTEAKVDEVEEIQQEVKKTNSEKISISDSEYEILTRIVEAEAGGTDIKGEMLVANVVLNRVNSDEFPNSIEEVVFQKGQFSPISDGRYYTITVSESTKEAVRRVLNGEDESQGALYFLDKRYSSPKNVAWFENNLTWILYHGGHDFYK